MCNSSWKFHLALLAACARAAQGMRKGVPPLAPFPQLQDLKGSFVHVGLCEALRSCGGCAVVVLAVISPTYAWRMARGPMVGCHPSFHPASVRRQPSLSHPPRPRLPCSPLPPCPTPSLLPLRAYGHYLAVILSAASLTAERLTIKPYMSMARGACDGHRRCRVRGGGFAVSWHRLPESHTVWQRLGVLPARAHILV